MSFISIQGWAMHCGAVPEFPVSNPPHGVIRDAEHLALGTASEARGARCDALGTWFVAPGLRSKGAGQETPTYRLSLGAGIDAKRAPSPRRRRTAVGSNPVCVRSIGM